MNRLWFRKALWAHSRRREWQGWRTMTANEDRQSSLTRITLALLQVSRAALLLRSRSLRRTYFSLFSARFSHWKVCVLSFLRGWSASIWRTRKQPEIMQNGHEEVFFEASNEKELRSLGSFPAPWSTGSETRHGQQPVSPFEDEWLHEEMNELLLRCYFSKADKETKEESIKDTIKETSDFSLQVDEEVG